jgi:hypothetical protein
MTIDGTLRLSEILLAVAFVQQAIEHLAGPPRHRNLFIAQVVLAVGIGVGVATVVLEGLLVVVSLRLIQRFDGPYNGGSDRLRLLVLFMLWVCRLAPIPIVQRGALGYLAAQVALSYAMAGWAKLANGHWRRGEALRDVFAYSVYPVSEALRGWAGRPRLLFVLSWTVMLFEALFPLSLAHETTLQIALATALLFHLGNACVFGLNRFLWIWLAGYPSLFWFQQEILRPAL